MSTSLSAMRKILFFVWDMLDDAIKVAIECVGDLFDSIEADFRTMLAEIDIYQSTIEGLLPEYERYYSLTPRDGDTLTIRRNRVIAALRARGEYCRSRFEIIAMGLGYSIGSSGTKHLVVSDGDFPHPFRADISRADIDVVGSNVVGASIYTVVVTGSTVESDFDLQFLFNKQRCSGTDFLFVND